MNVQLIIKYLHVGRYVSAFTIILLVRQLCSYIYYAVGRSISRKFSDYFLVVFTSHTLFKSRRNRKEGVPCMTKLWIVYISNCKKHMKTGTKPSHPLL